LPTLEFWQFSPPARRARSLTSRRGFVYTGFCGIISFIPFFSERWHMVRRTQRGSPSHRRCRHDGFTLVELLVVITIIGMLMAMVFPAIGSVIDAVRRLQCSQKLAGLGTALSLYRNQNNQKWPSVSTAPVTGAPGAVGAEVSTKKKKGRSKTTKKFAATGSGGTGFSWFVQLLPFIQEQNLYNSINRKSNNQRQFSPFDQALSDPEQGNRHLSSFLIGAYQCNAFAAGGDTTAPEYKHLADTGAGPALTNYVAMSGTHLATIMGSADSDGDDSLSPNGVITYRPKGGLNRVRDGDRTIVAAETREELYAAWMDGTTAWVVGHDPNSPEPQIVGGRWKCEGGCKTALNVGDAADDGTITYYRQQWSGTKPWRYGPSSMHPGGTVNHLLAGGNVAPIESVGTSAIDPSLYLQLITRDGEETVELP
jgi:prepilin-type N-terminal cleavage/methylation domain-containing protein